MPSLQHSIKANAGSEGVQQASSRGCVGERGVIIQVSKFRLFILLSGFGSAQARAKGAAGAYLAGSQCHQGSKQGDEKQALFVLMPVLFPHHFYYQIAFLLLLLLLYLCLASTFTHYSIRSSSPLCCLFLPSFPLSPPTSISHSLHSPSFPLPSPFKLLFQDNRADGRLLILYIPLENQLSC